MQSSQQISQTYLLQYYDLCEDLDIQKNQEIIQVINNQQTQCFISKDYFKCSEQQDILDVRVICFLISLNLQNLIEIQMSSYNLKPNLVQAIFEALKENQFLQKLALPNNSIECNGAKIIQQFLQENHVLKELDLSNNKLANQGVEFIAIGLQLNQRLRVLNLKNNCLENDYLGEVLTVNTSLLALDISQNNLSIQALENLINTFKYFKSLQILRLNNISLCLLHQHILCEALSLNNSLISLDIDINQEMFLDEQLVIKFEEALIQNTNLLQLFSNKLNFNEMSHNFVHTCLKSNEFIMNKYDSIQNIEFFDANDCPKDLLPCIQQKLKKLEEQKNNINFSTIQDAKVATFQTLQTVQTEEQRQFHQTNDVPYIALSKEKTKVKQLLDTNSKQLFNASNMIESQMVNCISPDVKRNQFFRHSIQNIKPRNETDLSQKLQNFENQNKQMYEQLFQQLTSMENKMNKQQEHYESLLVCQQQEQSQYQSNQTNINNEDLIFNRISGIEQAINEIQHQVDQQNSNMNFENINKTFIDIYQKISSISEQMNNKDDRYLLKDDRYIQQVVQQVCQIQNRDMQKKIEDLQHDLNGIKRLLRNRDSSWSGQIQVTQYDSNQQNQFQTLNQLDVDYLDSSIYEERPLRDFNQNEDTRKNLRQLKLEVSSKINKYKQNKSLVRYTESQSQLSNYPPQKLDLPQHTPLKNTKENQNQKKQIKNITPNNIKKHYHGIKNK